MKNQDLRRRAEAALSQRKQSAALAPATAAETQRLIDELQVHQIELEMQHEEVLRARAELETALNQYTDLYDFAPVGYLTLASDGAIRQANLAGAQLLGAERDSLINRRFGAFVAAASRATFNLFLKTVFDGHQTATCDVAILNGGADPLWAHMQAVCAAGAPGQPAECRAVLMDVSAARRAQEAMRQSEEHFRRLAQALPDAVFTLELPEHLVSYFNHDVFLGYSRAELVADITILSPPPTDDGPAIAPSEPAAVASDQGTPSEFRLRNKAGDWEWLQRREVVQARDTAGRVAQTLTILSIITECKQAADVLRKLSTHDPLTGLYNRGYFEEELARLERGRQFPVSLVMVDVDRLKETNDRFGHGAGDALLKHVAQVLIAAFRSEDVVTRIGGDEFAVLLPGTNVTTADSRLRRVRLLLEKHNAAHPDAAIRLSLGASTADSPESMTRLLNYADAAMYREKRAHDDG